MNWQEYQEAATRTQADQQVILDRLYKNGPTFMQLINGVVGLTNEVGELSEALKKTVEYGQAFDLTNLKEEVGDCLWRLNQICTALGITLEECAKGNILKLAKRYPDKYTDHLAAEANRDREAERNELEDDKPINETMDRHARVKGLGNWTCIDPKGNEVWQRIDGKIVHPTFAGPNGYLDDLRAFDKKYPMGAEVTAFQQTGQGWAEPPLEYEDPSATIRQPMDRIIEVPKAGYDGLCVVCHRNQVHHTNKMRICANCWSKAEVRKKYMENA